MAAPQGRRLVAAHGHDTNILRQRLESLAILLHDGNRQVARLADVQVVDDAGFALVHAARDLASIAIPGRSGVRRHGGDQAAGSPGEALSAGATGIVAANTRYRECHR